MDPIIYVRKFGFLGGDGPTFCLYHYNKQQIS